MDLKYLKYKKKYLKLKFKQLGGFEINDLVMIIKPDSPEINNFIGNIIKINGNDYTINIQDLDTNITVLEENIKTVFNSNILLDSSISELLSSIITNVDELLIINKKSVNPDLLNKEIIKYKLFCINFNDKISNFIYIEKKELTDKFSKLLLEYHINKAIHAFEYKDYKNPLFPLFFLINSMINELKQVTQLVLDTGKQKSSYNNLISQIFDSVPCFPYYIELTKDLIKKYNTSTFTKINFGISKDDMEITDMKYDGNYSIDKEGIESPLDLINLSKFCFRKMLCNNKNNCLQNCDEFKTKYNLKNYDIFLKKINIYQDFTNIGSDDIKSIENIIEYIGDESLLPNPLDFENKNFCCYTKISDMSEEELKYHGYSCAYKLKKSQSIFDMKVNDNIERIDQINIKKVLNDFNKLFNLLKSKKKEYTKVNKEYELILEIFKINKSDEVIKEKKKLFMLKKTLDNQIQSMTNNLKKGSNIKLALDDDFLLLKSTLRRRNSSNF